VTPSSATPSSGVHSVSTMSKKVIYKTCEGGNLGKAPEGTPTSASYFLRRFSNGNEPTLPDLIYSSPGDEYNFAGAIDRSFRRSQHGDKDYTPLPKDSSIEVILSLSYLLGNCVECYSLHDLACKEIMPLQNWGTTGYS
jgi:hypothetical protein